MMTFNQWPTTSFHCNLFATMSPGDHVVKRRGRWKDEMNRGSAIQSMTVEGSDHYQHHHIGVRPSPQPSTLFLLSFSHPHVGKIEGPRASVHMRENTQCSTMLIKEFIVFRCNGSYENKFEGHICCCLKECTMYTIGKSILRFIDKREPHL